MRRMNEIFVFTDGSSRGNPGPGGWGAIVAMKDQRVVELGGASAQTTNNRMELMAAINGLQRALDLAKPEGTSVTVYSDSSYVINGITKWVRGWKANGWKTKTKDDVMNVDLWQDLDATVSALASAVGSDALSWTYVGGHIGVRGNERCDEIATALADGDKVDLYDGPFASYPISDILDISHDESKLAFKKSLQGSKSGGKAYSYVSMVGGKVETHKTWAECERRVKGAKGARYKKALNPAHEKEIIEEFSR